MRKKLSDKTRTIRFFIEMYSQDRASNNSYVNRPWRADVCRKQGDTVNYYLRGVIARAMLQDRIGAWEARRHVTRYAAIWGKVFTE